jgi:hypothetical protein
MGKHGPLQEEEAQRLMSALLLPYGRPSLWSLHRLRSWSRYRPKAAYAFDPSSGCCSPFFHRYLLSISGAIRRRPRSASRPHCPIITR